MCQLSFIHSTDVKLSQAIASALAISNTLYQHEDGYGYFSNGNIFKTNTAPYEDNANLVNSILDGFHRTGIFHVRKASTIIGKPKTLREQDAHPFMEEINGSPCVLAHNGTLDYRKNYEDNWKHIRDLDIIDSHMFLLTLKEVMESNKLELLEGLQKTMKMFYGKFAFMISYKNNFFIVRGERAFLHQIRLSTSNKKTIFLVNTEKNSLVIGCRILKLLMPYIYGDSVSITGRTSIEELDKNTAFIFNPKTYTLEKIGEVEENTQFFNRTITYPKQKALSQLPKIINPKKKENTKAIAVQDKKKESFSDKLYRMNLTITEISYVFTFLYDKSILDATNAEMADFEDNLIHLIDLYGYNKRQKVFTGLLQKKNKDGKYINRTTIVANPNLEPLYFVNTPREIIKALNV